MATLNSIDAITMLPRTAEAAQVHGREQTMTQHAAEQPGLQFQQKTEHQMRQTVESQKSETKDYEKGKGKGNKKEPHKVQKKAKALEKEAPVAPRSNSSFDITI